jgi:hypothetical protein
VASLANAQAVRRVLNTDALDTIFVTMYLDKKSPIELFSNLRPPGPRLMVYRRFANVNEALRYAVEEIPRDALPSTVIQVNAADELQGNPQTLQRAWRKHTTSNAMQPPEAA